jgi:DNA helicase HerA-like ATPase
LQQRQQANQLERALHSLKGRLAHDKELSEEQQLDISRLAAEMESDLDTALPRGWILIDEAHNYIPQTGVLPSRPYLRRYVNEGRNLGLSIALATQQPSGLDSSIRRNADVIVVHSMSMRDDIDTTEAMLNTVVPESIGSSGSGSSGRRGFERVVRSLEPGFAMVSNDAASRVFPIRVRPRLTIHGGQEY